MDIDGQRVKQGLNRLPSPTMPDQVVELRYILLINP